MSQEIQDVAGTDQGVDNPIEKAEWDMWVAWKFIYGLEVEFHDFIDWMDKMVYAHKTQLIDGEANE